jgi:hypothetical protein
MGPERMRAVEKPAPAEEQQPVAAPPTTRSRLIVQADLVVGPADDPFEREADLVAREVVERLRNSRTQRAVDVSESSRASEPDPGRRVQRISDHTAVGLEGGAVNAEVEGRIRRASGGGEPLAAPVRHAMEDAFGGVDFGRVRLHSGPESHDLNQRLGARAFTVGSDIHFGARAPDTSSAEGQRLLAHELTHTLQQGPVGRRLVQRDDLLDAANTVNPYNRAAPTSRDRHRARHGRANQALEGIQGGTSSPGAFSSANSYQQNLADGRAGQSGATATGQVGDTTVQNNLSVAAGAMSGFDLVVTISQAIQLFTSDDPQPWDKAETILRLGGSATSTAAGMSGIAKVAENASAGSTTDVADKVLGEIAGFLSIFEGGFKIVKQIVALAEGGDSKQENALATAELIKGILETGKGVVDQINNFMSHLGTVSAGVVQAAPAIGIAINCIDMIMNGINIGYAYCAWADMQADKRASKELILGGPAPKSAGIRGFFGGHVSALGTADQMIADNERLRAELEQAEQALIDATGSVSTAEGKVQVLEHEIAQLEAKEAAGKKSKKKSKSKGSKDATGLTSAESRRLKKAKKELEQAKKELGTSRTRKGEAEQTRDTTRDASTEAAGKAKTAEEYKVSKSLQRIAAKRIHRGILNVSLTLPAIAGDIAILSGAGAAVGAGLKAGSGGGKLLAVGVRMAKQAYHNAKGDEKSTENKMKLYDGLIKSMTQHVIDAAAMPDATNTEQAAKKARMEKAEREIVASGMTIPKMKRLKDDDAKLYLAWIEALKQR